MTAAVVVLLVAAVLIWPGRRPEPVETADRDAHPVSPGATATDVLAAPVDSGRVATAMDLLALALRSGAGVPDTIDVVASELDPAVGGQLRVVGAALRWGLDDAAAWATLPHVWAPAGRAMTMAGLAGVPPTPLLTSAAAELRRAEEARLEVAAARLGVRLVLPLGLAFLPAFVLLTVLPIVLGLAGQMLSR